MGELKFVSKDVPCSINESSAQIPAGKTSSDGPIDFAGDDFKSKTTMSTPKMSDSIPSGGGIDFVDD